MSRWCLLLLFVAFAILGEAQDSTSSKRFTTFYYPSGVKSSEGFLVGGKPDGWWKSYDQNGILISEGNRKNFLLDSTWTFYNDKAQKQMIINYFQGQKEGKQIQYFPKEYTIQQWHLDTIIGNVNTYDSAGWLKSSVPYVEGKPHGMAKTFNQDGLVIMITQYYHGILSRTERINRTDNFGLKQGNWKYFWDNGNLKLEATYLNDKKHGFFKYYDENGNFLYVEKYDHDELVKDAKETKQLDQRIAYYPNGKPSIIATYFKDKPEGLRREFDTAGHVTKGYVFQNGWLRYEGITDLNGLRQGLWKEYYETGELRSQGKYKNSIPIGPWNFYFTDKTVEITGSYNNKGEKQNEWIWFYPNGDTMTVAHYEEGDLEGPYAEYDENGKYLVKGSYEGGVEQGGWYYRTNNVTEQGKYDGGLRIGLWETLYDTGKPAYEIHYDQGLRDGKYTAYWDNGNIKTTGKYIKGLQDGSWTQYDEDGTLILTTIFKNGNEIKWNNYTLK